MGSRGNCQQKRSEQSVAASLIQVARHPRADHLEQMSKAIAVLERERKDSTDPGSGAEFASSGCRRKSRRDYQSVQGRWHGAVIRGASPFGAARMGPTRRIAAGCKGWADIDGARPHLQFGGHWDKADTLLKFEGKPFDDNAVNIAGHARRCF